MLYVAMKDTKKIIWRDDAFDCECMNKASDFITSKGLVAVGREVTFSGDMVIWVKEVA